MKRKVTVNWLSAYPLNRRVMLCVISIIIVACVIDTSIIKLSAFTSLATGMNIAVFLILIVIYSVGSYIVLINIKTKIQSAMPKMASISVIHKIVSLVQYIITIVFIIIILQVILSLSYELFLLKVLLWITYGISAVILGFLAKKFLSWYRSGHDIVLVLYTIAMATLSANAIFTILTVMSGLVAQQEEIRPISSPVSIVVNADNPFNSIYSITSILSFISIWVATVFLLHHYSKTLGTLRYWMLVSAPLFYFLSQFQAILFNLFAPFRISDPILFGIIFTLAFSVSKPIGGILFGIAFWSASRKVAKHMVKDYLVVSAYGIILLFTSNQATDLILAPYPPFGLVTISFMGLASYMLLIGIYSSAISVSHDSELRKLIHKEALRESKLLDSIGSAQVENEVIVKVLPLIHDIEEESGIQSSLTNEDVKEYVDNVLNELRKSKKE